MNRFGFSQLLRTRLEPDELVQSIPMRCDSDEEIAEKENCIDTELVSAVYAAFLHINTIRISPTRSKQNPNSEDDRTVDDEFSVRLLKIPMCDGTGILADREYYPSCDDGAALTSEFLRSPAPPINRMYKRPRVVLSIRKTNTDVVTMLKRITA